MEDASVAVAWWASSTSSTEVPEREHRFCWYQLDYNPARGEITITTRRPHLDVATIAAKLRRQLTPIFPHRQIRLWPAAEVIDRLDPLDRLAARGYRVHTLGLAGHYRPDTAVVVAAELRGRSVWAVVGLDVELSERGRVAAAGWAETALEEFAWATPSELAEIGSTETATSRWQLVGTRAG